MGMHAFTVFYDDAHYNSIGQLIKIMASDWPVIAISPDPTRYVPLIQHNCQTCDPQGLELDRRKLGKHDLTTIDVRPELISFTELEGRYYGVVESGS